MTETKALPILDVETVHSHYLINQNEGTYVRTRVHEKASDLSWAGFTSGELYDYQDLVMPGVGERLLIVHEDGSYVHSTPVVSIKHIETMEN